MAHVRRYDRYIARHVMTMSGLVALVLIALFSFISFIGDVDDAGQGSFGLLKLGAFTVLMMPTALYTLLPVIALLGTMAGMGVLSSQSELTALRASGISTFRLAGSALMAGVITATMAVALGDFVAPWTADRAERLKASARLGGGGAAVEVQRPAWLRVGNDVVHALNIQSPEVMGPVELFELDGAGALLAWSLIDEMRYDASRQRWQLSGVSRTEFADERVRSRTEAAAEWRGDLSPEVLQLLLLEADSTSIRGLMRLVDYLDANALDTVRAERSLWRKLMVPFTVLAMTFFAVPFVFGSMRDSGMGQRLFLGVLIGVAFFVINEVSLSIGQLFGWPAIVGAGLPSLALVVAGFWKLRRAR